MKGTLKSIALVAAGFVAGGLVCSSTSEDEDEGGPDGIEVVSESQDAGAVSEDTEPSSGGPSPIPETTGEGVDGGPEAPVGD